MPKGHYERKKHIDIMRKNAAPTEEEYEKFLRIFANGGNKVRAMRRSGITPYFLEKRRRDDKEFAERLAEAEYIRTQKVIDKGFEIAAKGVKKDIIHRGQKVGEEVSYPEKLIVEIMRYGGVIGQTQVQYTVQVNRPKEFDLNTYKQLMERQQHLQPGMTPKMLTPPPAEDIIDVDARVVAGTTDAVGVPANVRSGQPVHPNHTDAAPSPVSDADRP